MKCAVLCNGPSRIHYKPSSSYDFVIGCNIPWTDVDATCIVDSNVVYKWAAEPDLIKVPAVFSRRAWMDTDSIKKRHFFNDKLLKIMDTLPDFDTSGHVAAKYMIERGYTHIDIWGCDSWFEQTIKSYTHQYFKNLNSDTDLKFVMGWRQNWKTIMENNQHVSIIFKRNADEDSSS